MNNKCDLCNRQQEHFADGKKLCWYHYPLVRGFGRCPECDIKHNVVIA